MRFLLFLAFFFFCVSLKSQTGEELKFVINKNNIAIRSLQKGIPNDNSAAKAEFKSILIHQQQAVKYYVSNNSLSNYLAFKARINCLQMLKKYSKGSTAFFELTEWERSSMISLKPSDSILNSESETKIIEALDLKNPQSLNVLTLTIQ